MIEQFCFRLSARFAARRFAIWPAPGPAGSAGFLPLTALAGGLSVLAALTPSHAQEMSASPLSAPPASHSCQVVPNETVELSSRAAGVLREILVSKGDRVAKGQTVARLHAEIETANLALAEKKADLRGIIDLRKTRVDFEARKMERNQDLAARNLISEHEIDTIRTDYQVAAMELQTAEEEAQLAALEARRVKAELEATVLVSPINGVVTERNLAVGERVTNEPVLKIVGLNPLRVETDLPVSLWNSVKTGSRARVYFDAPGIQPAVLKATLVGPVVEPTSGTFGVRFLLDNPGNKIPSGLKCRLDLL